MLPAITWANVCRSKKRRADAMAPRLKIAIEITGSMLQVFIDVENMCNANPNTPAVAAQCKLIFHHRFIMPQVIAVNVAAIKAMIAAGNRLVNKNTMTVTAMRLIVGIVLSDEVHNAIIMP